MRIVMAVVADAANISQEGKLNVLGVFDRITAGTFPARHPFLVFAFRIQAEAADSGIERRIRITLMDEDGKEAFSGEGTIKPPMIQPGQVSHVNQIISVQNIEFPRPGRYKFRVQIGDESPLDAALQVVAGQQAPSE